MYETKGGEPVDEDLNARYWTAKEGTAAQIESGFRTWSNASSTSVEKAAHTAAVSYSLFDFGIEKPAEPEEEEEEEDRVSEVSNDELDSLIDGAGASIIRATGMVLATTAFLF